MINQGLLEERIFVTGIPVGYNFRIDYNKDDLMAKFKLEKDKPIALIMGGGLGLGGVKNALCQLERIEKRYSNSCNYRSKFNTLVRYE